MPSILGRITSIDDSTRRDPWAALDLEAVHTLFARYGAPWWIAGGHAIELAVGHAFRAHGDVDVLILRRDYARLRRLLETWDVRIARDGKLVPCLPDAALDTAVTSLWCRENVDLPWSLEVLTDTADGADWVSRRNSRVRRPLDSIGWTATRGLPVLAPEIVLLYKSKDTRPIDDEDVRMVEPLLTRAQREWLDASIALADRDHPWRRALCASP